jgi:dephospho-CoA kinase
MVIGITGNYCSGKNEACAQFEQAGFDIIDVDSLGHEALEVKRQEVVDTFGKHILHDNGIDRVKLGAIVFGDGGKMKELERIVHPWMIRRVRHLTTECTDCVINAAMLIEMCLFTLCDRVIGILVDEEVAVGRAGRRDGMSREEALRRIRSQIPTKEKLHFVDTVIDNNGDIDTFKRSIASVIAKLR